jgi:hypothetical protein
MSLARESIEPFAMLVKVNCKSLAINQPRVCSFAIKWGRSIFRVFAFSIDGLMELMG